MISKSLYRHISKASLPLINPTRQPTASFHHARPLAMKVAHVTSWGLPPVFATAADPPAPSPSQLQLKVVAVGVPRAVQGRAAGLHSSSVNAPLPFDPSADGVGLEEATGDLYYVGDLTANLFAEKANVERDTLVKLDPGTDAVAVAGLSNPVASSWMALRCRAVGGCEGRTVLVFGATGASGRMAVGVARALGAARVIGVGRSADTLAAVKGLDERILLSDPFEVPPHIGPVHIVLDFVGGQAAEGVLKTAEAPVGEDLQYIHIGDLGGREDIVVSGGLLNKKPFRIMGSGMGSWSRMEMKKEIPGLVAAVSKMQRPDDVWTAPLSDVQSVWDTEDAKKRRLVLIP
ncbi:hypothetical protein F4821DRAFT_81787 [Hypoxylon rubiginosum]|uniref:Uncharacterized protein n=1 Tax=Hypoxylon rubiginosum TaxID=110542 RepID=A0ACC0D7P2_9PEZI|nr:hypothetical protein F4821DRAFT_81787 [Hypoxylon rubiginosum]